MIIYESATLDINALSEQHSYWCYNALDCCVTFEIWEALAPKEEEAGFAYNMSRKMQGPAFTMMKRGVKIDERRRRELISTFSARKARFEGYFLRLTNEVFGIPKVWDLKKHKWIALNYASPLQLKELFYVYLKLPPIKAYNKATKDYSASTNREALEKLALVPQAKIFCDLILAMRDIDKKLQLLLLGLREGRMHCSYQVAGTLTGRWASNADMFGSGTNLQNVSNEMRRIFVPDAGKKFAQLDLAQAESRLVAHIVLPFGKNYLAACNSGDLHTSVAKLIWKDLPWGDTGAAQKEIAKRAFYRDFSYRDMAKRGGHGSNYGGSSNVIAMHLKIPPAQAREFQSGYFGAFPELNAWHNNVKVQLVNGRTIRTSLGRRCQFLGRPWDNETIKSAIAYEPQSTIGDLLNEGMFRVWRAYDTSFLPTNPIQLLTQVHDSILFQYDPADEEWLLPAVQKTLAVVVPINGEDCKIGVDIQVGWNWGKYTPSNEFGLKDWNGKDARVPLPETSILDRPIYRTY